MPACAAAVCDATCVHGVRCGRRAGRGPKRHAIYLRDDFIITDNGGNTATLHAEVGNVDTARPTVDFHFEPLDGGDRTIITEYGKTEYYNYDLVI